MLKRLKARWERSMAEAAEVVGALFANQRGAIGSNLIRIGIFAAIAFVLVGIAANFVPTMMTGWEAARTTANASEYTGYTTVVKMAPTLIILGFVIAIGVVSFLGIKVSRR